MKMVTVFSGDPTVLSVGSEIGDRVLCNLAGRQASDVLFRITGVGMDGTNTFVCCGGESTGTAEFVHTIAPKDTINSATQNVNNTGFRHAMPTYGTTNGPRPNPFPYVWLQALTSWTCTVGTLLVEAYLYSR
jgi:hypothetical protein